VRRAQTLRAFMRLAGRTLRRPARRGRL